MKNFCALPFHHVMIKTNGIFNICCEHQIPTDARVNVNDHDHDYWLGSDYVKKVRNSFLADQRHPGCRGCWQKEDAGFNSERTQSQKEYLILPTRADRLIKSVEIDLGNLCNLRCLMCNENDSSAILAENVRLGINKIEQSDIFWDASAYRHVEKLLAQKPYIVNIRGGEPFYNKKLLELVQNVPRAHAKDMVLHITTNATLWNEQWQNALEKFRLIRFMFSVDAVGDLYEYIRYPASWPLVENNIKAMRNLPNSKSLVHCVGQNLNISSIKDLIHWCTTNSLHLNIALLLSPAYLQIHNLPQYQKELCISYLNDWSAQPLEPHLEKFCHSALARLQQTQFDPALWQQFVENISMRDKLRGNSFTKFIKEDQC